MTRLSWPGWLSTYKLLMNVWKQFDADLRCHKLTTAIHTYFFTQDLVLYCAQYYMICFLWPFQPLLAWFWCFVGFIIPGALLVTTGYVGCNSIAAVSLIITAVGFSGTSFTGWAVNHLDLAPPYAGENDYLILHLYSIINNNNNQISKSSIHRLCPFPVRSLT